jgi:hypothetical protein
MPDTEEVLTDMGVAQNSIAAAADAQIRPAFLATVLEITNMMSSLCFVRLLGRPFCLGEPLPD